MATLRDIRTRIGSVKSTKQITNAMKMVSAAKLRRATEAAVSARPWQQTLTRTLTRVAAGAGDVEHPLLLARDSVKVIAVVMISTDRGLCGGFNANLNRQGEAMLRRLKADGKTVILRTFGKKSRDYFKTRGNPATDARIDVVSAKYLGEVAALSDWLTAGFIRGDFDEAWIGFNQFKSTLTQVPTFQKVLPLTITADTPASGNAATTAGPDYLYEPDGASILGTLLPLYLRTLLLQAFLETEAGEHASRMTAMENATRNASDLISALTLEYNRGRQAAITKELIEIVSGAEAL
jgi:F-type H+-transporting ATPase subunit gamma